MAHAVGAGLAVCILQLPGLTHLRLSGTKVGKRITELLTNRPSDMSGLRTLDLFENILDDAAALVLAPSVWYMLFLEHLNLTRSRLGDSGV